MKKLEEKLNASFPESTISTLIFDGFELCIEISRKHEVEMVLKDFSEEMGVTFRTKDR